MACTRNLFSTHAVIPTVPTAIGPPRDPGAEKNGSTYLVVTFFEATVWNRASTGRLSGKDMDSSRDLHLSVRG